MKDSRNYLFGPSLFTEKATEHQRVQLFVQVAWLASCKTLTKTLVLLLITQLGI